MKRPLDRIDFAILAALQESGRLSNKELAARVGLAPSSCLSRVRRLERDDVLRGYHAEVDAAAAGIGLRALIAIRLSRHSRKVVDAFRGHCLSLPEVTAVHHVTGAEDFLVEVAVRDAAHLRDLGLDAFTTRPEVAHMQTSLIFGSSRRGGLPLYPSPDAAPRGVRSAARR